MEERRLGRQGRMGVCVRFWTGRCEGVDAEHTQHGTASDADGIEPEQYAEPSPGACPPGDALTADDCGRTRLFPEDGERAQRSAGRQGQSLTLASAEGTLLIQSPCVPLAGICASARDHVVEGRSRGACHPSGAILGRIHRPYLLAPACSSSPHPPGWPPDPDVSLLLASQELKESLSTLNDLRLAKERLEYDGKESTIQIDTLKETIAESERDVEELRKQLESLKANAKGAAAEEKERKKAEKMAAMMAKFDAEGTLSEKEDAIRVTLAKLNAVDPDDPSTALTHEDVTLLHRQLSEGQALLRDSHDRLRQTQEEADMVNRRREEVEQRLGSLEAEYEELLGQYDSRSGSWAAETSETDRLDVSSSSSQSEPFEKRRRATSTSQSPWRISRCVPCPGHFSPGFY